MSTKRRLGFTAFSMPQSFDEAGAVQILKDARKAGFGHVQFLINPDDRPSYYSAIAAAAKGEGIHLSGLYATFCRTPAGDVCPVLGPDEAYKHAVSCIRNARLMLGSDGLLCSPSLLRGLGDPDKGLVGRDDRQRQIAFLQRVQPVAGDEGVVLCVEPINRFETRGPNTVADTVKIIAEAKLTGKVFVLADTCHAFLETGSTDYAADWKRYAASIGLVHLSDINRGSLVKSRSIDARVSQLLNATFGETDLVIEGFTRHSPDGFFSPLMVHQPADTPVMEQFGHDMTWLKESIVFA